MYKVQNQEINLKLVKLVEDKDAQVKQLSEKFDSKFEQMPKDISEMTVPKDVEKPRADSQQGGEKEQEQSKPKDTEAQKESTPKKQQNIITRSSTKRPIIKGVVINPAEGSSSFQNLRNLKLREKGRK